jgi:nicotinamidase-related amidase
MVAPISGEKIITKNRISSFYNTELDEYLKSKNIKNIYFSGVSTDLAIESAVRDAHDRDYNVYVIEDCCIAATEDDHLNSLKTLSKISQIIKSSTIDMRNISIKKTE